MELTKESARKLVKGDFIPNGKRVDIRKLEFRRTQEDEVYQCCVPTGGHDPQSGPFYCGDIADIVAFVEDEEEVGVLAICDKCRRRGRVTKEITVIDE